MTFIPPQEYYKTLPQKRMAVGVLFFDENNRLLILKPTYKPYWSIPGGVVEKDESLLAAARREVQEEIGLELTNSPKLAAVDYKSAQTDDGFVKSEAVAFLFDSGVLSDAEIKKIVLDKAENSELKFVELAEAYDLLGTPIKKRIMAYQKKTEPVYLENGELI